MRKSFLFHKQIFVDLILMVCFVTIRLVRRIQIKAGLLNLTNKLKKGNFFKLLIYNIYFLVFTSLSGCTLYQEPEVPILDTPQQFKAPIQAYDTELKEVWWKNFNDIILNELVNKAVKNNNNYLVALKNIDVAQTYVSQNMSYLFPQVNLNFSSSRDKLGAIVTDLFGGNLGNTFIPTAGITNIDILTASVSYQVDIWNELRNSVKQSEANTSVAKANSNVTKLMLISNVVKTYFQIISLNESSKNLNEQLKIAKEVAQLNKVRHESGLIDKTTVYSSRDNIESIIVNIKAIEKQKQVLEYTLAYLLGEFPENFTLLSDEDLSEINFTKMIPAGISSQVLIKRPDIQQSIYQLLSYGYLEKQNIANFLPQVTLTGDYGYFSTSLAHLFSSKTNLWSFGVGITQFVFDYSIRMSEYKRSKYQYEAAVLSYKNTVINAFTEVNSALVSFKEDNEALNAFKKQYINSKNIVGISDARYHGGLEDYTTLLTNNINLLQIEYGLINQRLAVIQDIVQVYQTLGYGL